MAENEDNRASRMMNELLSEGLEQSSAPKGPILPRMRLVVTAAAAPVSLTKKKISVAEAPRKPASEMLPEILREVDEARRQAQEQRSRAQIAVAPVEEARPQAAAEAKPELRGGREMSRVRRRYSLIFGKEASQVFRPRRSEAVHVDDLGDKTIYQVTRPEVTLKVPSHWWESPRLTTLAFLAPAVIAFLLFAWLPMARGFVLSLQHVSLTGQSSFVGASNYARAFADPLFWSTFGHALLFCGLSLLMGFWLPVMLAIFMNELKRGQALFRLAFFLPFLTPTVPAVILWRWILDEGYGLANSVLAWIGISDPHVPWLNHPLLAMISVVIVFLWKNIGWNALIYMTALKEVPEELYEAAELDGASLFKRVRHISLPALRATMGVLLIMQVINSFQIFTEVYLLTQGGPMASTEVIATYLYKKSFLYLDIGYASALAVILFAALVSFTSLRMKTIEQEA